MAEFPALPLFTDAYLGDTTHLTTLEHGAYLLLLMAAWRSKDTSLPDDDKLLARYAGLTAGQWARIKPIIIGFFKVENGYWMQGRLTDEAKHVRQVSKRQSEKARDRWLKIKESTEAVAEPLQCPHTPPTPIDNTNVLSPPMSPTGKSVVYSEQFEHFWKTYPNRTGKAAAYKAYQSALKTHKELTHAILIDRAGRFAAAHTTARTPSQYIPHPATWLNQGRWEDDLSRITARTNGTQPAPNARGSQFSALMSAASELMQEGGGDIPAQHGPEIPKRLVSSPTDLRPQWGQLTGLPNPIAGSDTAGRQTIDYDALGTTDG
jgi:uncharacterized protein YdaU (DUF1376 family)